MGKFDSVNISLPTYSVKLPSNGEKVTYTPFRVGDEKTLLIASQSQNPVDMIRALKAIVGNCVKYPVDKMEQYDIEYLFLKLRAKSVGETSDIGIACTNCETFNNITVDLDAVVVEKQDSHTNTIKIAENIAFEMKDVDPELAIDIDLSEPAGIIQLASRSISKVYTGDEIIDVEPGDIQDIVELIEKLSTDQFDMVQNYFITKPKLVKDVSFVCGSCGTDNKQRLEGLTSFF